ncbi:hypothetical protein VTH8203_02150 [Vibrio thalassae]|uniref:DUF58 domain-containing protein n=2 Tax=Vibrio thalassae TaxID=1243014 RepID=A0A240EIL1_9VIBR|nr:hypothetical protein VTH8203_02150 [Vibrio thalassae]
MFAKFNFANRFRKNTVNDRILEDAIAKGDLPTQCNGAFVSLPELCFYQTHGKRWQPPAKSLWSQLNGQHTSPRKGRGMTFSEVRQYQPGDDVRQIDWRVTARTGKVHTKLFTEERERPVVLFIDLTSSMYTGTQLLLKSVQLCHLASLLSWVAINSKDRVGAVIRSHHGVIEIRPSNSKASLYQMLNRLVEAHNKGLHPSDTISSGEQSFSRSELSKDPYKILSNLCNKGSEVILLSDFSSISDHDINAITKLARHNRVRAIQVYDPIELGETKAQGIQSVMGRNELLSINFSDKEAKNAIGSMFRHQQSLLATKLSQYGIALSQISSGTPLLQQLSMSNLK